MSRVAKQTRREIATWLTLYIYCAQPLTACAPTSRGQEQAPGLEHATYALDPNFLTNYTLSAPDQDSYAVDGGIRARTPFTHSVSADGESQVTIPLAAPPGRNGIEPHLSFVYRHRANQGLLGRRWDLSGLSRIERCSKTRSFDGKWSDTALDELCLDGQRLVPISGVTLPPTSARALQTLDGNTRVLAPLAPSTKYVAQDRDGALREYDFSPGASTTPAIFQQTAAGDSWGNRMTIAYNADGSPDAINYTSNGSTLAPTRSVQFSYEPRVVATSRAAQGALLVMSNRLKAVTMKAPANLNGPSVFVRRYKLAYSSYDDVLASVTECFPRTHSPATGAEADEVCLDPVVFTYSSTTPVPSTIPSFAKTTLVGGTFPKPLAVDAWPAEPVDPDNRTDVLNVAIAQARSMSVVDVDGDGINDIVYMLPADAPYTPEGGCFGTTAAYVITHGRWYWRRGSIVNGAPTFAPEADLGLGDLSLDNAEYPPRALDVDGDGVPELIAGVTSRCWPAAWGRSPSYSQLSTVSLQLGIRHRNAGGWQPASTIFDARAILADFDGDGLVDRLEILPDRWQVFMRDPLDFVFNDWHLGKSGGLGLFLNRSTPPTESFLPAQKILASNPCHEPGSWTGTTRCGSENQCGEGCPLCNHCATDNVPHDFYGKLPSGLGCDLPDQCPVTQVSFDSEFSPATQSSRVSSMSEMLLADLDGSGIVDLVYREAVPAYRLSSQAPANGHYFRVDPNNFGAWDQASANQPPEVPGQQYYSARLVGGTASVRTKLNLLTYSFYTSPEFFRFADLNGDGLQDVVYGRAKGEILTARMNLGAGVFGPPIDFNLAAKYPGELVSVPRFAVFTPSGRVNVVVGTHVFEMRGDQWAELLGYGLTEPTAYTAVYSTSKKWEGGGPPLGDIFVDLNNDGLTDIVGFDGTAGFQPTMHYWLNVTDQGFLTGVSQDVNGSRVEYVRYAGAGSVCALPQNCRTPDGLYVVSRVFGYSEHEQAAEYDYAYGDSKTDVNGGGWLGFTSRTITAPARGSRREETYAIALTDRVFGTGACANCYFYPGARRPSKIVTVRDARLEGQSTPGQLVTRTERFGYLDQRGDGTASTYISYLSSYLMTETATDATGTAVAVRSKRVTTVRTRGTVTSQRDETWEGDAAPDGSPPYPSKVKWVASSITALLADDPTNWLMGLPSRMIVSSGWPGSTQVDRTVAYDYEPGRPVLKSATVEPDSTEVEGPSSNGYRLKTTYLRNQTYGVVEHVVEEGLTQPYDQTAATVRTRTSDIAYDQDWLFPRRVTNPLQQIFDVYHLPSTGALVATSRQIDQATDTRLDQVSTLDTAGRPVLVQRSGSPDVSFHYFSNRIEARDLATGLETTYIDPFGRPVTVESARAIGPVKVSCAYDGAGHVKSASLPYTTRADYRTYVYDGLGRRVRTDDQAAGTFSTFDYQPAASADGYSWKTTISGSTGSKHEVFSDAAGATAKTRELITAAAGASPDTWAEQLQTFGAFGQLTAITDAASNQIHFEYDRLGRPVTTIDPDSGTRSSHYNAFGELVRINSPLETIEFKRDQLSRVLSRRTTPNPGVAKVASFVWDQAPNAIGQLVSSTSEDQVGHSYSYNSVGLPQTETWAVGGQAYATTMEYDPYGRLQYLTYPSLGSTGTAPKLKYTYSSDGFVDHVEDARASSNLVFWQVTQRNPAGQVTASTSGAYAGTTPRNVGVTQYVYDRANRPVYQETDDPQTSQILLKLGYEHDATGKGVKARHDRSEVGNFVTEQYEHDLAGRLTDWYVRQGEPAKACLVGAHEQFKYSPTGNLQVDQFVDVAGNVVSTPRAPVTSTYGVGAGPSALSSQSGAAAVSCTYDAVGNQLTQSVGGSTDRQATFNADGQLATASTPSGSWRMDYDAFGDRVRIQKLAAGQVVAGADTLELGGLIARQPDGRLSFHVVVDNEVVAIISRTTSAGTWSEDVRYVFSDALGSPSAMVSSSGAVVDRPRYSPFGERRAGSNLTSSSTTRHPERLGFAAHVPDDDWRSIKMGVRSYDPRTTRFLSPDPIYNSGQQLNPYAYAANSPVNNVDPSGRDCTPTEPTDGWLCYSYSQGVTTSSFGGFGTLAPNGFAGPVGLPSVTPTAVPSVDDGNRAAPTPLSVGAAAAAFGVGAAKGAASAVALSYALGAVSAVCLVCAPVIGVGLLAYGVYSLVNGGAAALVASGTRIYNGQGTVEDFDSLGAGVGTVAGGLAGRSAFAVGRAFGGAMKGLLKPTSAGLPPFVRCFPPGTLVLMADGTTKRIEEVQDGDEVLADDPQDFEKPARFKVAARQESFTEHLVAIEVEDSAQRVGHFQATREHPFWVRAKGWTNAKDLGVDDILMDRNGEDVRVLQTAVEDKASSTYNLSIDSRHTFFVSENGVTVLAHNADPFEVGTMSSLTGGTNVGDGLFAHEPLPNAYLRAIGYGKPTRWTFFRKNPAIALSQQVHDPVSAMQLKWGIKEPDFLRGLNPQEVVHTNYEIMLQAGVPEAQALEVSQNALDYADQLRITCP
jgi:RHS repeat-associated protein